MDYVSWETSPDYGSIKMPGRILALQSSQLANQMWALCSIKRRWWEFWRPPVREEWVCVTVNPPNPPEQP